MRNRWRRNTLRLTLLALALSSCATRHSLYRDYQATLREGAARSQARQTTVIILVDGLGLDVTRALLAANALPRTGKFFDSLHAGSAVFPSLTYPNIASILTGLPVDGHPVSGNSVMVRGTEVNFENPSQRELLNQLLAGKTWFSRFASEGRTSVSFSHSFHEGATAHLDTDVKSGLAYVSREYDYIDQKAIDGLGELLEDAGPGHWPELVFLHLTGYDALAHRNGPASREALSYLRWLDGRLDPVYAALAEAEKQGFKVRVLLTSDHGFEKVTTHYPIERVLRGSGFDVLNQYRVAPLYSRGEVATREKQALYARLASRPEIEAVVEPGLGRPRVYAKRPLPEASLRLIEAYFRSPLRPDAVAIAASGVSFHPKGLGQHGGLSRSEIEVPLLLRGASLRGEATVPAHVAARELVSLAPPPAPVSEAVADGDDAEGEPAGIAHALALSSPVTRSWIRLDSPAGSATRLSSGLTPSLNLDWRQIWSSRFSTTLGFGMRFYDFRDSLAPGAAPAPNAAAELRAGSVFRFSSSQTLTLGAALAEEVLESSTLWVPRVDFETRKRLWSLGIGDLGVEGGLGLLLPSGGYTLGFQQKFGAHLEMSVATTHLLRLGILARHFEQPAEDRATRSGWDLGLGAFYELGL